MMPTHELLGFDPKTLFGKQEEIRSKLITRITQEKMRFGYSSNGSETNFYDAVRNAIAGCIIQGMSADEETHIQEGRLMDPRELRTLIGKTTARLFLPYVQLQEETGLNIFYLEGKPDGKEIVPLLDKCLEGLQPYAECIDQFVERLQVIAQRKGIAYALRRNVRDGFMRSIFDDPEEYGMTMLKGVTYAITLSYIQPARIVEKISDRPLRKGLRGTIQSVLAEKSPMFNGVQTAVAIELNRVYLCDEIKRIWRD